MDIGKTIKSFLCGIASPIVGQLPFFLISFTLLTPGTLGYFLLHRSSFPYIEYFHFFSLSFLTSYLFTTVVHRSGRKWVKGVAYAFFLSLFAVYVYLYVTFRRVMSPALATVVAETDSREAGEFLSAYVFNGQGLRVLGIILAAVAVIVLAEWLRPRLTAFMQRRRWLPTLAGACTLLALVCGFASLRVYTSLLQCKTAADLERWNNDYNDVQVMDLFTSLLYASFGPQTARNELGMALRALETAGRNDRPAIKGTDSLTVVLVLGESHIKEHSSIYGYPLQTTPTLAREQAAGRLFVFDDIVSPYNMTSLSIKNIMCTNSIADGEQWYETPFFPTIFRRAGYTVYSWDNQLRLGEDEAFAFSLNGFLFHPQIQASTYAAVNDSCYAYDQQLVDDFYRRVKADKRYQLIIFHLMGQHFLAESRYPHTPSFEYFTADSIRHGLSNLSREERTEIALYDNATRYNDYVLGNIIGHLRDKKAVLVYLSDHGEEVYDYRRSMGRTYDEGITRNMARYQNGVPFVVWCSDSYRKLHPDIIADLRQSLRRKGMTDNTCQLLFRLACVRTAYYRQDRDLSNRSYRQRKRIIYDNIDYDKLKP